MKLKHRFVDYIPKELENEVIYISIRFSTVVHKCACGCGNKTVTPLSPTDWRLIYNGKNVSLYPSIGNWQFPCKSHYWISENIIEWGAEWSDEEIKASRMIGRQRKDHYYHKIIGKDSEMIGSNKKRAWWKSKWLNFKLLLK